MCTAPRRQPPSVGTGWAEGGTAACEGRAGGPPRWGAGGRSSLGGSLRAAWDGVVDLALPATCAACGAPSSGSCCRSCLAVFRHVTRDAGLRPDLPVVGPAVWSACAYEGVAAALLVAYKDGGRRHLVDVLAGPLGATVYQALGWAAWPTTHHPLVVPVPTASAAVARRGDRPLEALTRAACATLPGAVSAHVVRALRVGRRVRDQSRLSRADRAANVAGAFALDPRAAPVLAGRGVVLVDDVATSGATLAEAERVLVAAGVVEVRAAVVARTTTRRPSARIHARHPSFD